jgi:hypothetical protein
MLIGFDFDNTLISYDRVFRHLAEEAGMDPADPRQGKTAIRDWARRSPEGDIAWQRLQARAYGPRIHEAEPAEGALAFLETCHRKGIPARILSHKSRFAAQDPQGTDLREAAMAWLQGRGFLAPATGLGPAQVHFLETRAAKVEAIALQGCTHFVDDLEETFLEPGFPAQVQGILYLPEGSPSRPLLPVRIARSWAEIAEILLHA